MKIHKEGYGFITTASILLVASIVLLAMCGCLVWKILAGVFLFILLFLLRFFRFPNRPLQKVADAVLAPCDGTVVIVEEAVENEYFKDKRIQVSIFMSVHNVHINWVPLSGRVDYFKHHQGKYLLAKLPKSSELNERTTYVVDNGKIKLLFRQIAGFVARRIVTYVKEGEMAEQNQQLGFIKFGSRMDLFFPVGTTINVKVGDTVKGTETIIANI